MELPRSLRRSGVVAALILFAVSLAPPVVHADDEGLTLAGAVARALQDGYSARIAALTADQAGDTYRETRGAYLPHFYATSGAGTSNRRDEKLIAFNENGKIKEYGIAALAADEGWLNVFVEQLVFDMRQWRLMERDKIGAELARIQEGEERERVARDVTSKFAEVVRLERQADLALIALEDARKLDSQARKLFEAGRSIESEREAVALRLAESEMQARNRRAEAREVLESLWLAIAGGDRAGIPASVAASSLPKPELLLSLAGAEEAVSRSPTLRALDLRRRVEEASAKAASARRLPTLGFKAGYSHYGADRYDLFKDQVRVGIDFTMPLFDGFEARSAAARATKGVQIARLRYQSRLELKQARVRELARRLESASERSVLSQRRAESSRERQRLTDLRLQSQRATLEEALAARERTARDAEEAANAYFKRFDLWASLQHEMGRLAPAVLGPQSSRP
jgi:outer membrane protein TolC